MVLFFTIDLSCSRCLKNNVVRNRHICTVSEVMFPFGDLPLRGLTVYVFPVFQIHVFGKVFCENNDLMMEKLHYSSTAIVEKGIENLHNITIAKRMASKSSHLCGKGPLDFHLLCITSASAIYFLQNSVPDLL